MNETVLVVDDERYAVEGLIKILEEHGYATLYESDGVFAMRRFARGGVHAVVADGSIGGDLLAGAIRKRDKSTPIALYTGSPPQYRELEKIDVGVFAKWNGPKPVADYIHTALQKGKRKK